MDDSPTKQQVEDAKLILLRAHKNFLDGDPAGIPLDMSGEDLRHANFDDCNFGHASFKRVNFSLAKMEGASLGRAKIKDAKLPTRFSGNKSDRSM